MASRKRRPLNTQGYGGGGPRVDRERDLDTVRLINTILSSHPVDVAQLRKIAAVRGLVNNQVRCRVWPWLLGVEPDGPRTQKLIQHAEDTHRDSHVVQADVARSLIAFTRDWQDDERKVAQDKLKRLLTAVVTTHEDVYYYQGLHDIAGVVMLVVGEKEAYVHLDRLVQHHLRDCTRPDLDPVMQVLHLLPTLLAKVDPPLAAFIQDSGCPPFYAISWVITWFSHSLTSLSSAARVFDALLASPPLMPLYMTAAGLKLARGEILAVPCDLPEVHHALQNVDILPEKYLAVVIKQALHYARQYPPSSLAGKGGLPFLSPAKHYPFPYMDPPPPPRPVPAAPTAAPRQVPCCCRMCHPRPEDNTKATGPKPANTFMLRLAKLVNPRLARASGAAVAIGLGLYYVVTHFEDDQTSRAMVVENLIEAFSEML